MTKSMKRIHKVTIKRMIDDSPDTSWLGEYGNTPQSTYAIDRAHDYDCPFFDNSNTEDEQCTCRQWSNGQDVYWNNREYRYFNPNWENYKGLEESEIRQYCRQDFDRMESLNNQQWGFIGIRADAEYSVNGDLRQDVTSGGLWGIESDSGDDYFTEVEQEQLAELKSQLAGIGFSSRAIAAAFKEIEHKDE